MIKGDDENAIVLSQIRGRSRPNQLALVLLRVVKVRQTGCITWIVAWCRA